MKVTDYIAQYLAERGVTHIFEMSGGMITHLLDSIHLLNRSQIVSVHHEQTAAFAAEAFGRMTGIPGVALATSGPGATNLLTGIGSCHFDSTPAVFITGQVNRNEQKGDRAIRQLGFQETDIVAMAAPITKAAWQVREPADVPEALARAFAIATEGRPGPVLIDIPMDVQRGQTDADPVAYAAASGTATTPAPDPKSVADLLAQMTAAERPLLLVGGGVRSGRAAEELRAFVDAVGVPVVHSLMGVDVLPYEHPLNVGLIGSYGNRWVNLLMDRADFVLVLGSRLDIRQTGADTAAFKGERVFWHVDCEAAEINNRVTGCRAILSELRPFLTLATTEARALCAPKAREDWRAEIAKTRETWPDTGELAETAGINPNRLIHQLSAVSGAAAAFVIDVGQHQMWAAQSVEIGSDQRFLTSGGMGAMGFALPAAIGAAFAAAPRPVVLVAGDGGFQTNIQELQTVFRNRLPVKLVILDNGCHGMVRQFQESYFDRRYQSTMWGYSAPDFAAVAQAYGIPSTTVGQEDQVEAALAWLWSDPNGPALLNVKIDANANAYPKIAFGRPMTDMEPFAKPIEMEGT